MIWIEDGRKHLFQWDLNRRLVVDNAEATEVHYHTSNKEEDLRVLIENENDIRVAKIPNELLQKSGVFRIYLYDSEHVLETAQFEVKAKCKPEEYIYTETDVIRIEDVIARFIEDYFENNQFIIDANYEDE